MMAAEEAIFVNLRVIGLFPRFGSAKPAEETVARGTETPPEGSVHGKCVEMRLENTAHALKLKGLPPG